MPLAACPSVIDLDEAFHSRYCFAMSTEQLIADAMALPLLERVSLAQALWESIDAGVPEADERAAVAEAIRRDQELSSGRVAVAHMKKSWKRRGARSNEIDVPSRRGNCTNRSRSILRTR